MKKVKRGRRNPKPGITERIDTLKNWLYQQGILKPERKKASVRLKK